jgi:membrane protease YdiL (CAAX protease family)
LSKRFSWPAFLGGVPLFVAYNLLYWTASILVVSVYPAAARLGTVRMLTTAPFALIVAFIVVNSIFEEATVVGYVVTALSDQGPALSITASALLRFLYHLYQGPVASLAILPLGLLFAAVYWRWRNLWPLLVAHSIANCAAFALAVHRPAV